MCAGLKIVNPPAGSKQAEPRHQRALLGRKFNGPGRAIKFRPVHTSSKQLKSAISASSPQQFTGVDYSSALYASNFQLP